jgi:hypothetical protein
MRYSRGFGYCLFSMLLLFYIFQTNVIVLKLEVNCYFLLKNTYEYFTVYLCYRINLTSFVLTVWGVNENKSETTNSILGFSNSLNIFLHFQMVALILHQ